MIQKYSVRGDPEYDKPELTNSFPEINFQPCAKGEHVPVIERSIRTFKERGRATCHSLPYKRFPIIMCDALVSRTTKWTNAFPSKSNLSTLISPSRVVEGKNTPDLSMPRISFGAYAIVFLTTLNTMKH